MKITDNHYEPIIRRFDEIEDGEAFYDLVDDRVFIKLYDSHGEANGVAFCLTDNLEEEVIDDQEFGVYSSCELVLTK